MKKLHENNFMMLSLVALIAVVGIIGLTMVATQPKMYPSNENVAGDALSLKPTSYTLKPVRFGCCLGSDGVLYDLVSLDPAQTCKDDYEGQLVDLSRCDEPEPVREACCLLEENPTYALWLPSAECADLGGELILDITNSEKCEANNLEIPQNDDEKFVCCQRFDSEFLYGYGAWIELEICEQLGGQPAPFSEEECGTVCVKHDSVIEWVHLSELETINDLQVVPASYCE